MVTLGVGITGLQYLMSKSQDQTISSYIAVDESHYAVSTLTRELRTARPGDNGAYIFELASDNELIFYSDIDKDGQSEKIRYLLEGHELKKFTTEPTDIPTSYPPENTTQKIITSNVRNGAYPVFYYFNSDWPEDLDNNPLPTPANLAQIRMVRIFLRINPRDNEPEKDYELESFTQIRTLKDNL